MTQPKFRSTVVTTLGHTSNMKNIELGLVDKHRKASFASAAVLAASRARADKENASLRAQLAAAHAATAAAYDRTAAAHDREAAYHQAAAQEAREIASRCRAEASKAQALAFGCVSAPSGNSTGGAW